MHTDRFFRNLGGQRFEEVTEAALPTLQRFGHGCAAGDFNADGFTDLYVANYGKNSLLLNNGDGTHTEVGALAGVDDDLWGTSTLWFDVDADGDLDLYVANYTDWDATMHELCQYDRVFGYCGPRDYTAEPDRVFVNQGDGSFLEQSQELGLSSPDGKALGVVAVDLDNDGLAEVYVANDMCGNFLFTRSRPPLAKLVDDTSRPYINLANDGGSAVSETGLKEASMGIACGDFDRDGLNDIFLTHFEKQKSTLYRNRGKLMFEDVSRQTEVARHTFTTLGFGTIPFDYDRDGCLDLFLANGHVIGSEHPKARMKPQFLYNRGKAKFVDISEHCEGGYFERPLLGRCAAGGDFDNDGDLDIAVSHLNDPLALLDNETQTNASFVGIDVALASRASVVGARVTIRVGKHSQTLPIKSGGSYLASPDPRLLFGVPLNVDEVEMEVTWPSGATETHRLGVGRYWRVGTGAVPTPLSH